jgi:hypothetical protein
MEEHNGITLGEVYRLCERIETKVNQINGTVGRHSTRITVLEDRGTRDNPARAGGVAALFASAGSFLYQLFTK